MCGFAGLIGAPGWAPPLGAIERMTRSMVHRGPDDEGFLTRGQVQLGFRRLAILDLSSEGHQPMVSPDGRFALVFNGAIFNYIELREELRALGHTFRSTGDTEVLLAAYASWGRECLTRLNGMYAFLVHDRLRDMVFGARDPFGIKPLYIARVADAILLASEIKAIVRSGLYQPEVDWPRVALYLGQGRLDTSVETLYAGVRQVEAGTWFEISPDLTLHSGRFWEPPSPDGRDGGDAAAVIARLVEQSVRLRLRADVPVGVCLSGGIDSTAIACLMARHGAGARGGFNAFCYHAEGFDERSLIAETASWTGIRLHELDEQRSLTMDRLVRVLEFQDEPVHSMAVVMGFGLMELARAHDTLVVLNGQGADEIFAGYDSYFRIWWRHLAAQGRVAELWGKVSAYSAVHGGSAVRRCAAALGSAVTGVLRERGGIASGLKPGARRWPGFVAPEILAIMPDSGGAESPVSLGDVLRRSTFISPLPLYLRIEDRNSMAHSVEARLPFLDPRVVEYGLALPDRLKLRGPWNKAVLRDALRSRIPDAVRTRPQKMGFPTSADRWFASALNAPCGELLREPRTRQRGIIRTDVLVEALRRGMGGVVPEARDVFRAVQVELWLRMVEANRNVVWAFGD
ncbi:MAG: asparagine synthase (glutamine-hydrolyzing) [Gemmatimonadota bacterium]